VDLLDDFFQGFRRQMLVDPLKSASQKINEDHIAVACPLRRNPIRGDHRTIEDHIT